MSENADVLISLQNVNVVFDGKHKITFEDVELCRGDWVSLLGRNGSGKSTLCKIIVGLARPSKGHVMRSPGARKLSVGYLPQAGGLCGELTIIENIDLQRQLFGLHEPFDPRLFQGLWDLGLADEVNTRVANLSGGFARLTALAAVLAAETKILVLDEPFSGLDEARRTVASQVIASAAKTRELVIVTAHDPGEIDFANRRITLGGSND